MQHSSIRPSWGQVPPLPHIPDGHRSGCSFQAEPGKLYGRVVGTALGVEQQHGGLASGQRLGPELKTACPQR